MLILLDIDGTLLNSNNEISEKTKNTIINYSNKNQIILTSARKPSSIKAILNQLRINDEIIICYNEALVLDGQKNL